MASASKTPHDKDFLFIVVILLEDQPMGSYTGGGCASFILEGFCFFGVFFGPLPPFSCTSRRGKDLSGCRRGG
jgi:hypothetical protein